MKISELMLDPKFDLDKYIKDLQKKAELGEHYKHLYSEVKKQKDDVVELIKKQLLSNTNITKYTDEMCLRHILRMLGEINE